MIVLEVYRSSDNQNETDLKKTVRRKGEPENLAEPETGAEGTEETEDSEIRRVFICSPFHPLGKSEDEREKDLKRNIALARYACSYAIGKKCIPYAPHLYFPQILSEDDPDEREIGILFGLDWLLECDELWIIGRRVSEGMEREIRQAKEWDIPIKWFLPKMTAKEGLPAAIFGDDKMDEEMKRNQNGGTLM